MIRLEPLRRDLPIVGMTCSSCVRRVERALSSVPGVEEARVDLATEAATVTWRPATVTVDDLARVVAEAGYKVVAPTSIQRQTTFPVLGMTCGACARHVEASLMAVPGVTSASASLVTGRATVVRDPALASFAALQDAVRIAGFDIVRRTSPRS